MIVSDGSEDKEAQRRETSPSLGQRRRPGQQKLEEWCLSCVGKVIGINLVRKVGIQTVGIGNNELSGTRT